MLVLRILALLLALAAAAPMAHAETWTVVSEEKFPPYNTTENGKRVGLDVDIVDAVLKRIGVEPEHRGVPWNRVVHELDQNQVDIGFQFIGRADRFEAYNLVGPHRSGLTVFAVPADSPLTFATLEDLRGKTVGVVQGFSYTAEFDAADYIRKDAAIDNTLNIRKLVNGRLDAVIGDLHTLSYLAKAEGAAGKIKFLPKALSEVPRYIAFPKARKDKADRFAKGLEELKADGTIDAILSRWQGS